MKILRDEGVARIGFIMGREVKRVAIDFDWPMNVKWPGYLISVCNDSLYTCEQCKHFAKIKGWGVDCCPQIPVDLDPPKGEGWQMWETTSEGSPISPVFDTPEKLAQWLSDTGASSFGRSTATYDQWLAMIKQGWAMSMVADSDGIRSGVEDATK